MSILISTYGRSLSNWDWLTPFGCYNIHHLADQFHRENAVWGEKTKRENKNGKRKGKGQYSKWQDRKMTKVWISNTSSLSFTFSQISFFKLECPLSWLITTSYPNILFYISINYIPWNQQNWMKIKTLQLLILNKIIRLKHYFMYA